MSEPSIKKNFAYSTAYQILSLAVPFITTPYVSRVLGADGIGIYSFTSSIVGYFAMFASLGTMSYGAREISRARNDRKLLSHLFWEIELLVICTTAVVILFWGAWIILAPEYNIIYLLLTVYLLGTVADISWFFTGLEQFKLIVMRNAIVRIAGVVLLFIFIRERDDLILYIFLIAFVNLLGSLSMWIYIPRMIDKVDWKTLRIKKHLKETFVYFIPTMATSIYTILNKVLLGFMGGDISENGFYEQATKVIMMGQALTFASLNSVLGARISYLFAERKIGEIHERINKSVNYILLMGLGLMMGLIAIAPRFVPWFFGPGFEPTILLIQLLSALLLIIGISNCLGSHYYTPAGLRKQSARYIIVGAVVNLFLNILLIPCYGAVGAVIGSLAAELTITVLYLWNCNGYMTLSKILNYGWRKVVAAIVMLLVVRYVSGVICNNAVSVILSGFTGVIIYGIMLLIMHDPFSLQLLAMGKNKLLKR